MAFTRKSSKRRATSAKKTVRRVTSYRRAGTGRVKVWSASEISKLRKSYRNTTNSQIAKSLGRTVASVRAKAGALSLKKNKNFLSLVAKTAGVGGWKKNARKATPASRRRSTAKNWSRRPASRRAKSTRKNTRRR